MEKSAGVLVYRVVDGKIEILLGETGGPFWNGKNKNNQKRYGIPKGLIEEGEKDEETAIREFEEETGLTLPKEEEMIDLGVSTSYSGKEVHIFAIRHDFAPGAKDVPISSMNFSVEWPPKSGLFQEYPELNSAAYFSIPEGEEIIFQYQKIFLQRANYLTDM